MPAWRSSRDEFRTQWKASIVATLAAVWCRSGVGIGLPPIVLVSSWDGRARWGTLMPSGEHPPGLVPRLAPSLVGVPPGAPVETSVLLDGYRRIIRLTILGACPGNKLSGLSGHRCCTGEVRR